MLESLGTALQIATTPEGLLLITVGCMVSFTLGVIPGLSSTEGMLILLPFTFGIGLDHSMLLMCSAYASGFVGAALTSIVLGIPGSGSGLATIFDGHPLHRRGRTTYAITIASISSAVAGLLSLLIVIVLLPFMKPISLLFGPVEWFVFVMFGLTVLSFAGETSMVRGLFSAGLGLLVGTVGLSGISATPRFTLGFTELWGGVPVIAAFIGLYPLAEAFYMALGPRDMQNLGATVVSKSSLSSGQIWEGTVDTFRHSSTVTLSTFVGWIVGVIPGVGATFANLLNYLLIKGIARDKSAFGKGDIRGLIASETSNNASVGGALIPTLALGIPGSVNTAILLGVFLINGVQPGANIFLENVQVTWTILIAVAAGTIISSALALIVGTRFIVVYSLLSPAALVPVIVFISCLAVLLVRGNPFDLILAFALALLGVMMKECRLSRLSFVIALMLGPLVESSFFQSLSIGRGSYLIFLSSPIALMLWAAIAITLGSYAFSLRRSIVALRRQKALASEE